MITCPRCGYQAPDGTPYCPRCGYGRQPVPPQTVNLPKQDNMLTCPKCGLMLPAGSQYCSHCGSKLQGKQSHEKKGFSCGTLLLIAFGTVLAFFVIMSIGSVIYKTITKSDATPTMSANAINITAQRTVEILRTETAIASPPLTQTPDLSHTLDTLQLTPTSTEQAVSYCNNMLLIWKSDAEYLRTSGSLTFDSFDYQLPESCKYTLSGNSHEGKMILYLDHEGIPYVTDFAMDVSDPVDQDVLIGWVSAVASYLDMGTPTTIRRNLIDSLDTGVLLLKSNAITIDRDSDPVWKVEITRQN